MTGVEGFASLGMLASYLIVLGSISAAAVAVWGFRTKTLGTKWWIALLLWLAPWFLAAASGDFATLIDAALGPDDQDIVGHVAISPLVGLGLLFSGAVYYIRNIRSIAEASRRRQGTDGRRDLR